MDSRIRRLFVCLMVALVFSAALVGCGGRGSTNGSEKETGEPAPQVTPVGTSGSPSGGDSGPEISEATEVITQTRYAVITMPAWFKARGGRWVEWDEGVNLEVTTDAGTVVVAGLQWDERSEIPAEVKEERFDLGGVDYDGLARELVLHLPYVDADGGFIYGGSDVEPSMLACEYYLQASAEEVLSWFTLIEVSTPDDAGTGVSGRTSPFWGVWAYASKDSDEALEFAGQAEDQGFDAEVFLTTDWSNLNDEPWFVVSLGCFDTEEAASGTLDRAHEAGYADAYAKYSGDYVG